MHLRLFSLLLVNLIGCSHDASDKNLLEEDTASAKDTADIPDWVEPEIPEGPIPATEGSDTAPEEEDFDWSDVGRQKIGNSFPLEDIDWEDYPQYGTAQILDWSDNDGCVCFDIDCNTCSLEDCSAETCTYALNDNHILTKYHVEKIAVLQNW